VTTDHGLTDHKCFHWVTWQIEIEGSDMVKFIHTSDWQIGMKGGGLGEKAGKLVGETRIQTVDKVLSLAEAEGADFVLACGDLFEDNKVAQPLVEDVARILRAHADVPVHVIPGNHDLPGPGSVWNRAALAGVPNLTVHTAEGPVAVADGATLHPFPVRSRYAGTDPLEALPDLGAEAGIHLAMAHGHLTSVTFGDHEAVTLPLDPKHVERSGLDYLALGHWHGTRIEKTADGMNRIAYSGTHEQTAYREKEAGNVLVVEIAGKGGPPSVRPHRTGTLTWAADELAFSADANLDRLRARLEGRDVKFLRLALSGELPDTLFEPYRALLEAEKARFSDLRVRDEGLRWRTAEAAESLEVEDAGLREVQGRLLRAMAEGTEEEKAEAREALVLFRRFVRET
jgi:DNA repair exonuclease SbcCD nuclease subunit